MISNKETLSNQINGLYLFLFFCLSIGFISISGCKKDDPIVEDPPQPIGHIDTTMMVDVGGYHLYAETKGEGSTTIVFENGLGDYLETWKEGVYDGLSNEYQLIVYNRANYAPSEVDSISNGRNLDQIAKELEVVIDSLAQNEKVVLVGHSLGGPIIRTFARDHADRVQAMLFVDPAHEGDYTETSVQEFQDYNLNDIPNIPELLYVRAEIEQLTANWQIMNNLPLLPNIPVTVLTAMSLIEPNGDTNTAEERQIWYDLHESLGEGVDNFIHDSSDQVGHHIHEDDPTMVLDAILDLVAD